MNISRLLFLLVIVSGIAYGFCEPKKRDAEDVKIVIKQYDRLIVKQDADSIALLYTKDGELGNMAYGRDSIRQYLSSFRNLKVLSQVSFTESVKMKNDSCFQKGSYLQVAVIANRDTVWVKRGFLIKWVWVPGVGWRIKRMETKYI